MKATICAGVFLFLTSLVRGDDFHFESTPLRSSDGMFEVYGKPAGTMNDVNGKPYAYGTQVFLRASGGKQPGALLLNNDRWMAEQWCPGTHLLGVEDDWDTHQTDVYVYEVSRSADLHHIVYKLVFKSPWNDYDRQWSIEGWEPKARAIRLKLVKRGNDDIVGHEKWVPYVERHLVFRIGTKSISDEGQR